MWRPCFLFGLASLLLLSAAAASEAEAPDATSLVQLGHGAHSLAVAETSPAVTKRTISTVQQMEINVYAKKDGSFCPGCYETSFRVYSNGKMKVYAFHPGSSAARVDGSFDNQFHGWVPSLGVYHLLTVFIRSNGEHTFRITDGSVPSVTWQKNFTYLDYYQSDVSSVQVIPNTNTLTTDLTKQIRQTVSYDNLGIHTLFMPAAINDPVTYTLPYIDRSAIDSGITWSHCSCWGDPHCTALGGTKYDFMGIGVFDIAISGLTSLRAQTFQCPTVYGSLSGVSHIIGIAVQVGQHLVQRVGFDTTIDGQPVTTGTYSLAVGVDVDVDASYIVIKGPTTEEGYAEVRASTYDSWSRNGWTMNVYVEIPVGHVSQSTGLCNDASGVLGSRTNCVETEVLFAATELASMRANCTPTGGISAWSTTQPTIEQLCSACDPAIPVSEAEGICQIASADAQHYLDCQMDYCGTCGDPSVAMQTIDATSEESSGVPYPTTTTATTTVAGGGSSATSDPHCENARGERFDIFATGSLAMVRVPGEGGLRGRNLTVSALIRPISDRKCEPTVIKEVDVRGDWLFWDSQGHWHGDIPKLIITPGPNGELQLPKEWVALASASSTAQLFPSVRLITHRATGSKYMVRLNIHGLRIDVKQRKGRRTGIDYLDLHVRGLKQLGPKAGGLLGFDDHTREALPRPDCEAPSGKAIWLSRDWSLGEGVADALEDEEAVAAVAMDDVEAEAAGEDASGGLQHWASA